MARAKTGFWSRSLGKLKGTLSHTEPAPEPPRPAKKKKPEKPAREPVAKAATAKVPSEKPPTPAAPDANADANAAPKREDEKTATRKIPVQPWYRHRQRW